MAYPNIAAEMARRHLTQEQLCEELRICRKTLYNWMTKGHIPSKKLEEMADLFGVSTDYLLGRNPKQEVEHAIS